MKLPLLLALLVGAVSALHLRPDIPNLESPLGDETLPQDGELPRWEAESAPTGELMPLEEEEEGSSGSEEVPEEDGAIESVSALDEVDIGLQCPKEEDTVKLVGSPGFKTSRFLLVRKARRFNQAQIICRRCYRGNLISIHSLRFNYQLQCSVRAFNQGQVWIGGKLVRSHHCKRFRWVDNSCWNFAFWAAGQPLAGKGRCVALCTQGGHWRCTPCGRRLPFICSY
ncbi:bone marrow proteoglycan [Castor canadensis]|nr:bone marrow proteoglycan isoform X2 [Castor canadensis]XP_020023235.1 bone marrow proteoglycan isoform X2 [Castor canadensis]